MTPRPVRDAQAALALALPGVDVSRETIERLIDLHGLLLRWNPAKNLVASSTLSEAWERHFADALQLAPLLGGARRIIDLGSGGGFPALPIACLLAENPGVDIHCVESKLGKAAFIREAARALHLPVHVHAIRIEDFVAEWTAPVEAVTARALAPLADLIAMAFPLLKTGALGLFPKGQDVERELTVAARCWTFSHRLAPSVTDPTGRIVIVETVAPRLA